MNDDAEVNVDAEAGRTVIRWPNASGYHETTERELAESVERLLGDASVLVSSL